MELITSTSNPKIRLMRALQQRKQREATGLCLVEGIFHVGEAMAAGAAVEYLCYAPDMLTSDFAWRLVRDASAAGTPSFQVSAPVLAALSEKEHPQGLLAVVRTRLLALADLSPASFSWGVALVAPQDPGNVGAILRTVDAVGASGLILLDGGVDPYHPSSVRASMGALFGHPVATSGFAEWAAWCREQGCQVVGTSARASTDYRLAGPFTRPMMLLLGSEREGLSAEQAAVCHQMVRLPMHGRVTSLNLAVAAGIMLYAMLPGLATAPASSRYAPDRP